MERSRHRHARAKPKASTSDVVGDARRTEHIPPKWRKYYNRLVDLRDALLRRQVDLTKDAIEEQPSFSSHIADAGTDTYDRDLAFGMLSSEQDALYEIDSALNRIRNGTYGRCELTGRPIEPARLEAIPWTRFSAEALRQLENEGAVKRARLGPRQTVTKGEREMPEEDQGAIPEQEPE